MLVRSRNHPENAERHVATSNIRSIALLNDTACRANPGCQLTSRTLRAVLEQAAAALGSDLDIRPHPWGFAKRFNTKDHELRRLVTSGRALEKDALRRLGMLEYGHAAFTDALNSDAIVFQPEGTVSDGDDVLKILRLLSLPLYAANFESKPVIVMNGTFPLFSDSRDILIHWLRDASAAFLLRDRISAQHWMGDFMPDTALTWPGRRAENGEFILITTGAEVSEEIDKQLLLKALEVCRLTGAKPLIATKGWKRFQFAERQVKEVDGEFYTDVDLESMDDLLMKCRLHVGGRYHMAILAATKGVPSVLIRTNTHKNEWLAQEFEGVSCCELENVVAEALAMVSVGHAVSDGLVSKTRVIAESSVVQCARLLGQSSNLIAHPVPAPSVPRGLRRRAWKDHAASVIRGFSM